MRVGWPRPPARSRTMTPAASSALRARSTSRVDRAQSRATASTPVQVSSRPNASNIWRLTRSSITRATSLSRGFSAGQARTAQRKRPTVSRKAACGLAAGVAGVVEADGENMGAPPRRRGGRPAAMRLPAGARVRGCKEQRILILISDTLRTRIAAFPPWARQGHGALAMIAVLAGRPQRGRPVSGRGARIHGKAPAFTAARARNGGDKTGAARPPARADAGHRMTGAYGEKPAPVRAARVAMPSGKAPGFTGAWARGVRG